jgi:hypothetical protein
MLQELVQCAPADMTDDPAVEELPDGKPSTLTPWIVGELSDRGIVQTKHKNLVECINKYNAEIKKGP